MTIIKQSSPGKEAGGEQGVGRGGQGREREGRGGTEGGKKGGEGRCRVVCDEGEWSREERERENGVPGGGRRR